MAIRRPLSRPNEPSPARDPNNPGRYLTNQEWRDLWDLMMATRECLPYFRLYNKNMVAALLNGKDDWLAWQKTKPEVQEYDFIVLEFATKISLKGAVFTRPISFAGARFNKDVDFSGATFEQKADFNQATFKQGANFEGAIFMHEANFEKTRFDLTPNFHLTEFKVQAIGEILK